MFSRPLPVNLMRRISLSTSLSLSIWFVTVTSRVGAAHDLLDVRSRDQRARQHRDLFVDVRLYSQPGHQRLEHRLGVDKDARRRFVTVRNAQQHDGADHGHRPRDRQPDPAPPPHAAQRRHHLVNDFVHRVRLIACDDPPDPARASGGPVGT